ncbi:Ger(x)C family spore germination protein [Pseudalkalibacillus sp. A8]|uniref:Ger(x)C family spore germination protein n=1 Tax=Pseudalkalibacillus sp. A8 TaxID=3382641 RepID=UPI0038B53A58
MIRKLRLVLIPAFSIVLLTACWSKIELNELALVSAIGIDKNEEGEYVGSLQIINPGSVAGSKIGQGSAGPPVSVYTSTDKNLVGLSRDISAKVSRRLYYAHTSVVVIGEELAREEGINNLLDALDRDPNFRTTTTIIIAKKTKAVDVINTLTPIDQIPADKVIKMLKTSEMMSGKNIDAKTRHVIDAIATKGKEPVITGVEVTGEDGGEKLTSIQQTEPESVIQAGGIALFKNDKLVDWAREETARGIVFLLNKVKQTAISIDWNGNEEAVVYNMIRQSTNVKPVIKNGKPEIDVHVKAEGKIGEVQVAMDLTNPATLKRIEQEVNKEIKGELSKAIEKAKENKTDIFGFGESFHSTYPEQWRRMEKEWNDTYFPELKANIKVESFIRRTGLRNKPYLIDTK